MATILHLQQLKAKKHTYLDGLSEEIINSFGQLTDNFIMIVWGKSGNGKTNFLMQFLKALMPCGKILYIGLEEGFEASFTKTVNRHLQDYESGIMFTNHTMTWEEAIKYLRRKGSPKFIVIDSVQYWGIQYKIYKRLKETFPHKTFIYISHAKGREPSGKTAIDIQYDAGVKVYVEGYVAFVTSRYKDGVQIPYVIWPDGAKKYWKKDYKKLLTGDINPFKQ